MYRLLRAGGEASIYIYLVFLSSSSLGRMPSGLLTEGSVLEVFTAFLSEKLVVPLKGNTFELFPLDFLSMMCARWRLYRSTRGSWCLSMQLSILITSPTCTIAHTHSQHGSLPRYCYDCFIYVVIVCSSLSLLLL